MAHDIQIATESELRGAVGLDLILVDVIEQAFMALGRGRVVMPPVMSMELPGTKGEVDAKTAFIPGFDYFALKVSTGFYDNAQLGLPSLGGLMVLFSATTGRVEGTYLDNGYLTDLRTAAAGAVAARHMAPQRVETAGVIGTGLQARLQIEAAHLVRPFARVLVTGRDMDKARTCAADLAKRLGIVAEATADAAALVAESQLVVTTTPAREPVLKADWLHPGLHITAMGSDADYKNEIDPAALPLADAYVCDRTSQCATIGELRSARAAGLMQGEDPAELGQIILGDRSARRGPDDITICDLTGTGAQDTAIANHVRATFPGLGTVIRS